MHDELRGTLARQGIDEASYLKVTEQDRVGPPRRLPAARREAGQGAARALEGRRGRGPRDRRQRGRRRGRPRPRALRQRPEDVAYFDSERGRSFIRSTLRRSQLVEKLVDEWLAAHPEHPALPHLEDDDPGALSEPGEAEPESGVLTTAGSPG